jgi:hypothetical protein
MTLQQKDRNLEMVRKGNKTLGYVITIRLEHKCNVGQSLTR